MDRDDPPTDAVPPANDGARAPGFADALFRPVAIDWLVWLRVAFGVALLAFVYFAYAKGWNYLAKAEGLIHFAHAGFEWLPVLPPRLMHATYIAVAVCGALIAAGLFYRPATVVAAVAFGYLLFLDQTIYQNHLYLVFLLAVLLIFMPAQGAASIDAMLRPRLRRTHVPAWTLGLVRFQLGVVYFYGGLAKLNPEWMSGRSVASQLVDLKETMHEGLVPLSEHAGFVAMLTWGGLAFDLLIVPMLLWRKTRLLAFLMVAFFHVTNALIFPIDFFPWFMLAATAVFFPPEFPRRVAKWAGLGPIEEFRTPEPAIAAAAGGVLPEPSRTRRRATVLLLVVYASFQILYPLRIYVYPGEVYWTGLGDNFSWQMRTMSKQLTAFYVATDRATGRSWVVEPRDYLVQGQLTKFRAPEMYVHLAREIARRIQESGEAKGPVEMRAIVLMSLNRGERRFGFNPNDDLTKGGLHEAARRAVLPLSETWELNAVRGAFAREFQAMIQGEAWPANPGPFSFAPRGGPGE